MLRDPARLEALRRTALLDTPAEETFDRITRLTSRALRAPVTLLSLVDAERQFFKSSVGLPRPWASRREIPVSHSLCQHVVVTGSELRVEDSRSDPRFQGHPAAQHGVIAYAGVPVSSQDGHVLGTLCAIAHEPRRWSDEELQILRDAAALVMGELALRTTRQRLAEEAEERRRAQEDVVRRVVEQATAAEERESARQVQRILEAVTDAFVFLDPQWRYTYVNEKAGKIFGRAPKDLVGKHIWTEFPEGVGQKFHLAYEQAVREQRALQIEEYYPPYDRWFENRIYPSKDGLAVFFQDVTERKRMERELAQAQKMEAVGRLAGGVAHDFNNLLTVIVSWSELILFRDLPPGHPARTDVEEIRRAALRAVDLTRQLLVFSRQQPVALQLLDLNEVLSGAVKLLGRLIGDRIELQVHPGAGLGPVLADPAQLTQVIVNLAINARDAMPQGGRLTIETAPADVAELSAPGKEGPAQKDWVRLTVSDTGSGLDAEARNHLFEPFFTTKEGGTGLGLAIVYGVARQSGGHVRVESEPGHGSRFHVYLPRASGAIEPAEKSALTTPARGGSETILVAENDEAVRLSTCAILQERGYDVLPAASGEEALRVAQSHGGQIHLVLTDVVMPRMDGVTLAARIREMRPETRALFISGDVDEHLVTLPGGTAFLAKPFGPAALAEKVRTLLDAAVVRR